MGFNDNKDLVFPTELVEEIVENFLKDVEDVTVSSNFY